MNKIKSVLFVAGISLALAFTFSCSANDNQGGNNGGSGTNDLCNGESYDTSTYRCELGELIGKCRGKDYYITYEQCVDGVVVNNNLSLSSSSSEGISSSSSDDSVVSSSSDVSSSSSEGISSSSSDDSVVSSSSDVSSSSSENIASSSSETPKCGTVEYNPTTEFCQSPNVVKDLCGTATYTADEICHYGKAKRYFTDTRDGNKYVYVTIGTQTWMAENLNYNASGSKCGNGSSQLPEGGSLSDENTTTCDTYGRLYNWATANTACPSGWHLPSNAEWNVLMKFVNPSCTDNSTCDDTGTKLKSASNWNSGREGAPGVVGTDDFGFSALPGGLGYSAGGFDYVSYLGFWWGSSERSASNAYNQEMGFGAEFVSHGNYNKSYFMSVRCIKD